MPRRSALAVLLLAQAAVSRAGASFTETDLYLQAGSVQVWAVEAAGELRGDGVRLEHTSGRLSGDLLGAAVDLRAQSGQVTGTIGDQAVELRITGASGALAYEGLVGEQRLSGVVSPQLVSGALGTCMAALGLTGRAYQGMLECGAGPQRMALALPTSLSDATDEEQVALVVALLWTARAQVAPER